MEEWGEEEEEAIEEEEDSEDSEDWLDRYYTDSDEYESYSDDF